MTFVCPINTITVDCSGNVLPNALLLADVDGNKNNELLVGTQDGELFIYKFLRGQPDAKIWRRAQGLGFITAVTVGNLGASNSSEYRPVIYVANAEGAMHLFVIRSTAQKNRVRSAGGSIHSQGRNESKLQLQAMMSVVSDDEQQQQIMPIAFSQQLICNPKILLFQEYNDNEKQLIMGYSDRSIRIFTSLINEDQEGRLSGRIVLKYVYNVAEPIHTISAARLPSRDSMPSKDYELVVSQPGGNIIRFNPNDENGRTLATDMCNNGLVGWTETIAVDKFHEETLYASVCQDHIDIYSNQLNRVVKTVPLSVKSGCLCGLSKGPMTKDDYSQIVVISSVDGDTFLIDRLWNVIRFRPPLSSYASCGGGHDSMMNTAFSDQIQAFTAGYFGDMNTFCFIYVLTHDDKIVIVHSLEINNSKPSHLPSTLSETMKEQSTAVQMNDLLHPPC